MSTARFASIPEGTADDNEQMFERITEEVWASSAILPSFPGSLQPTLYYR